MTRKEQDIRFLRNQSHDVFDKTEKMNRLAQALLGNKLL